MDITLDQLLSGKPTIIKGKEYLSTKNYVEPFLERMSKFTDDFRIQVKLPDQVTITKDNDIRLEDQTFNRVWVQAVLPDEMNYPNHKESVNLLYALDTRKPIVKLFKNSLNMACLNMTVFNPAAIEIQELTPETPINYKFVQNVMEMTDNTVTTLKRLADMTLSKEDVFDTLGRWVDNCIKEKYDNGYGKVKLSETLPIAVYKNLFIDDKSPYYCMDGESDFFNIYNAWTDLISNDKGKDIVNKFEKTYLVSKVLNIV